MKPFIGVSQTIEQDESFYKVSKNNLEAISQAGGIPLGLPYLDEPALLNQLVEQLDGLYLTGGDDINPILFGEEPHRHLGTFHPRRDEFELELTKKMLLANKPVFGVCKGAQILNIAAGGKMFQDIYAQKAGELLKHMQKSPRYLGFHHVNLTKDSILHKLLGKEILRVNSFHHQANSIAGEDFKITGYALDGVVEVIESTKHHFALGVQWHPEMLAVEGNDADSKKIYQAFITACEKKRSFPM